MNDSQFSEIKLEQSASEAISSQPELPRFAFAILDCIKTSQQQNGLRQRDYFRYRRYCARRLHRLRRVLKLTHGRKAFQKRKISQKDVKDKRYFCIPLMHAERAWGYSQQLQNEMSQEAPRKQFHMIKRLNKAAKWSCELLQLCNDCGDSRTALEAEGYSSWMNGNILLQTGMWSEAFDKFNHSKRIFSELAKTGNSEQKVLYLERVEEMEPNIKYCLYNISRETGEQLDKIKTDTELDESIQQKLEALHKEDDVLIDTQLYGSASDVIVWKNEKVPIRNDKVRHCIEESRSFQTRLHALPESKKDHLYAELFKAFDSSLISVRRELAELSGKRGMQEPSHQETTLMYIRDYLLFHKSKHTLEWNEGLAIRLRHAYHQQGVNHVSFNQGLSHELKIKRVRPANIVAAYQKLLQILRLLHKLNSDDLPSDVEARATEFRAARCFYLAESYSFISKWLEAVALYQKCHVQCNEFFSLLRSEQIDKYSLQRMNNLEKLASSQKALALANGVTVLEIEEKSLHTLDKIETNHGVSCNPMLVKRLNVFDGGTPKQQHNLTDFPLKFEHAPCKPMLFDLALNSISFGDLSARQKQKRGRFFGLFS